MAEQPKAVKGDRTLTNGEVNRFLAAKAPEKPCPECGTNRWFTTSTPTRNYDKPDPDVSTNLIPEFGGPYALPVVTLHCGNCGFVKMYVASIIEQWVVDNG